MSGTQARGVSLDGSVVVGFGEVPPPFLQQAFRWTADGGMAGLGYFPGSNSGSGAVSASSDGSVVVGAAGFPVTAFRWTPVEGMVQVGPQPGVFSRATDVSADGTVIVGNIQDQLSSDPFRWTAATGFNRLGPFTADAVSADGLVVVGAAGSQAVRWIEATGRQFLGDLPGGALFSTALDVSGDGSVVVGFGETDNGREAMFWTQPSGMVNVREFLIAHEVSQASGWKLITTEGVSDDGRTIVGTGENPAGLREGWIATIPEPATISLAGLAGISLFASAYRRSRRSAGGSRLLGSIGRDR
jgi:uncharacterized membrane protein